MAFLFSKFLLLVSQRVFSYRFFLFIDESFVILIGFQAHFCPGLGSNIYFLQSFLISILSEALFAINPSNCRQTKTDFFTHAFTAPTRVESQLLTCLKRNCFDIVG